MRDMSYYRPNTEQLLFYFSQPRGEGHLVHLLENQVGHIMDMYGQHEPYIVIKKQSIAILDFYGGQI